jgi:fibulin 1/2
VTGHWDDHSPICIPQACPRLSRPVHGTILPATCVVGKTLPGERCDLHCSSGFKPVGKRTAVCGVDQNWEPNDKLECVAMEEMDTIKPFIKCPADATITLTKAQKLVYVQLERPTTNVDWWKYVDSHPAWGKTLEAKLPFGTHVITFRARSPNSNLNDVCRTIITVKNKQPPEVIFCPENIEIVLEPHEIARSITWKEPEFKPFSPLKQISKSKVPGQRFASGVHYISYIATDSEGQSSKCNFRINVKKSNSIQLYQQQQQQPKVYQKGEVHSSGGLEVSNHLENHETYLLCPGKNAIKIQANYPKLHLPHGCVLKNVRLPHQHENYRRNHQQQRSRNNVLRHYRTWDDRNNQNAFYQPIHRWVK